MLGAEPMTVPHSGIQYAQPSSWKEPGGIFRLAASACVVMPIAAQTTVVVAIIRAIVMLYPRGWDPLPAGSQIKQAGSMLRNQKIRPDSGGPAHHWIGVFSCAVRFLRPSGSLTFSRLLELVI
jgi:hypothetical protein